MNDSQKKILALTFDDGPSVTTMAAIMEILNQYHAKATFFVVGNNITNESVSVLKQAAEQGFEIGNHSESHMHMSKLGRQQIITEVKTVQEKVERAVSVQPVLFRPPYLDIDSKMLETIEMPFISGYGNNDWDDECSVEERVRLALQGAGDGAILLMHCFEGNDATVEALRIILPELRQQGYQMVTVSQLFSIKQLPLKKGIVYSKASYSGS